MYVQLSRGKDNLTKESRGHRIREGGRISKDEQLSKLERQGVLTKSGKLVPALSWQAGQKGDSDGGGLGA